MATWLQNAGLIFEAREFIICVLGLGGVWFCGSWCVCTSLSLCVRCKRTV
ncbi:uncharacterized protein G2W53_021398 [Senna tora]|uniref:Uncharacterized protein n=1 Tax=Senna tora TaxID=362788 RepID=A0A834TLC2_9FABA|nr:uncharacterized protein G2W53_021398 [Senna tora]